MFRICRFWAWVRACKLVGCRENFWSNTCSFCGILSNGFFTLAARDCGCQGSILVKLPGSRYTPLRYLMFAATGKLGS